MADLKQTAEKFDQVSKLYALAGSFTLNRIAFAARRKVMDEQEKKFKIEIDWVRRGIRVNKSHINQGDDMHSTVYGLYWGTAGLERGGKRPGSKPDPWIIPTKDGERWLKAAGFTRRKPKLKKILKTKVDGKKPFFRTPRGQVRKRGKDLQPSDAPKKNYSIFERTGTGRQDLTRLFTVYDPPLQMPKRPWFFETVDREYDETVDKIYAEEVQRNFKKFMGGM